jgi:glutamine amidotransferase
MCLLVVCNPNSTPSKDHLTTASCSNPHGFGFAIETPTGIITERSMSAKKSIKRFLELREQYPDGYAMWHARYATHGVKNEANCHPFKVGGTEYDTYLAHNGVLDILIPENDKRSDTRIMAEELLPRLGGVSALDDEYVYDMISSWASGSKVAVMTNDPSAKYRLYIINESAGSWDDSGIWWSNNSHKPIASIAKSYAYDYDYTQPSVYDIVSVDGDAYLCPNCEAIIDLEDNDLWCTMCDSCLDCQSSLVDCLCWTPDTKEMIKYNYGYDYNKWYSKQPLDF